MLHQALCIISKPWVNSNLSYSPERSMWVKFSDFCPVWPWNLTDDLEKRQGTSSMLLQALCIIYLPPVYLNWSYSPETLNLGQNPWFFVPVDPEIWWMTLKYSRAPLLYYVKLCLSFQSNKWIQTWVTVRKRSILVKINSFLSRVTLKFDRWPWSKSTIFAYHFKAISEFKLEKQSGNA